MKIALIVIAVFFGAIFLKIHHDRTVAEDEKIATLEQTSGKLKAYIARITKERDANTIKEAAPDQELGAASKAVRSFFRAWKDGRYADMKALMTPDSAKLERFDERIRKATLNWRGLKFINEHEDQEGWLVDFSIEVTSPESALAAVVLDEISEFQNLKGSYGSMQLQPLIIGIERFKRYPLAWRVTKQEEKMLVHPYPKQAKEGINILSYVMNDTIPMMRSIGMFRGPGAMPDIESQVRQIMAFWLTFAKMELHFDENETTRVITEAQKLIHVGSSNINMMGQGVKADLALGRNPQFP